MKKLEVMDIEKLMIGDYVLYNQTPMKIYAISKPMPDNNERFNNKAKVTLWDNGLIDATSDDIEPIIITKEMLESNGFEKVDCYRDGNSHYRKGKIYVTWCDKISLAVVSGIITGGSLKYLEIGCRSWHTLQHFFYILTDCYLGFNK